MKTTFWRRPGLALATLGVGLFLALVAGELLLRVVVTTELLGRDDPFTAFMIQAEGTPRQGPLFRPSGNRALGIELVPGAKRGHIRINSDGFRGPDRQTEPPQDTVRIAVIGDSETFAAKLPESRTMPGALENRLRRLNAREYQVLNFGVPGYNTAQQRELLQEKVLAYRPNVVVLYYVFNDPELTDRTLLLHRSVWSRSYLFLLAAWWNEHRGETSALARMREDAGDIVEYYRSLHASRFFATTTEILSDMGRTLGARDIRFLLVIAPELVGYDDFARYPYHDVHQRLLGLASEDTEVVDPLDDLAALGRSPRELWVAPHDPHKNALANAAVAATVARQLSSDPASAIGGSPTRTPPR